MGFEIRKGLKFFLQNTWNKIAQFQILRLHSFVIALLHLEDKKVF
jgi:hypothetical protein